jgi:hypothetical protein
MNGRQHSRHCQAPPAIYRRSNFVYINFPKRNFISKSQHKGAKIVLFARVKKKLRKSIQLTLKPQEQHSLFMQARRNNTHKGIKIMKTTKSYISLSLSLSLSLAYPERERITHRVVAAPYKLQFMAGAFEMC